MWRLSPQGGDFFRREKYYPALDRPQATADAVRQSFQRQKEKSAFGSPSGLCPHKEGDRPPTNQSPALSAGHTLPD